MDLVWIITHNIPSFTLRDLFWLSEDDYFNPKYKGNKNRLLCFRNYGIHNSRRKKNNEIN